MTGYFKEAACTVQVPDWNVKKLATLGFLRYLLFIEKNRDISSSKLTPLKLIGWTIRFNGCLHEFTIPPIKADVMSLHCNGKWLLIGIGLNATNRIPRASIACLGQPPHFI